MADEPTPLPTALERAMTRLSDALRSQTNGLLKLTAAINEAKQQLTRVDAKVDHLIATELAEAQDVREIRAFLFDASQKLTETNAGVKEARKELEEISDRHQLPTPDELQREDDARRWRLLRATAKFFRDHWPHITFGGGAGAAIYHFLQRFFH